VCRLLVLHRSVCRYEFRPKDDRALRMRLKELAYSRPRYGYRRLTVLLQREGWPVNHKRIYRIYGEEALLVRTKRRKKRAAQRRLRPLPAIEPGEHWSIDFMSDQLADGRRLRVFTAIDQVSRECVCLEVAQRFPAETVTQALDEAMMSYGQPKIITSDNVLTPKSSLPWKQRELRRLFLCNETHPYFWQTVPLWSSTCDEIPSYHSDAGSAAWRPLLYFKQTGFPVEGPSIIYEVLTASTARLRGIDPLGTAAS